MSIDDERELRRRLGGALETITPPPAPVAATLRRGRTMRAQRRIGVAAGLALAVGIGVAVPSIMHQFARQAPVSPAKPTVTVNPAGPNAPHGVIGSGKIGGKSWQLLAQKPGAGGTPKDQCFLTGGAVSAVQSCVPGGSSLAGSGDLAGFASLGGPHAQAQYGAVAPDVTRVTVTLADGTVLVLHPTKAYGQRYVAFAIPLPLAVTRLVAYSGQAELGYSVPFNDASGATITTWLHPGQRGLPRATRLIGSGNVDGSAWSETVHAGPWGYCLTGAIGGCLDTESRSLGNRVSVITGNNPKTANWVVGTATGAVGHVRVTLSGSSGLRVPTVAVGGPRFFAFAVPRGARLLRVTFYTASGRQVATQLASQIF